MLRYMLLFLGVFLFHLLGLLRMSLFHLLFLCFAGLLFLHLLMLFFLLLLELLVVLLLLGIEFVLLLLIFLVQFWIAGVRSSGPFVRLNFAGMRRYVCRAAAGVGAFGGRIVVSFGGGRCDLAPIKFAGFGCAGDGRFAVVYRSAELLIGARLLNVLILSGNRRNMPLTFRSFLFRRSPSVDATLSAVVAHAVYRDIFHARVVHVVDYRDVDIVHRPVVEKVSVVPTAAFIPMPEVTEAVADAAIETDSGTQYPS